MGSCPLMGVTAPAPLGMLLPVLMGSCPVFGVTASPNRVGSCPRSQGMGV